MPEHIVFPLSRGIPSGKGCPQNENRQAASLSVRFVEHRRIELLTF